MNFAELFLTHYNLQFTSITEISTGVSNTKYKVETTEGYFFLKQMRHQNTEEILKEFELTQYLHAQNIPLVLPIVNCKGEEYTLFDSNLFIVYPFVDFDTDLTTRQNATQVGEILARIHIVPQHDFHQREQGWFTMESVFKKNCTDEKLLRLYDEFKKLQEKIMSSRRCIIHGDSWSSNYLFQKNKLTYVTDWEGVDVGTVLHELGVAFMGHAYPENIYTGTTIDFALFRNILQGYETQNKLTVFEKSHLYETALYGALFSLIYVYVLFNIQKSKPDMDELYKNKIIRYNALIKMGKDEFYKNLRCN